MGGRLAAAALACAAIACSMTRGRMVEDTANVSLRDDHFRYVKAHVVGESTGYYVLTFIPLSSPSYSDARKAMYDALGEPVTGRPIALIHQTEDLVEFNVLLWSKRTIRLSADFIEFTDPNAPKLDPIGAR